jgi:hypothetical protein
VNGGLNYKGPMVIYVALGVYRKCVSNLTKCWKNSVSDGTSNSDNPFSGVNQQERSILPNIEIPRDYMLDS